METADVKVPKNGSTTNIDPLFDGTVALDDHTNLCIVALFVVQHLGQGSASDILSQIQKLGGIVDPHSLDTALEGMRSRGLLSYASGRKKGGENVAQYRTRKIKFSGSIEVAHISKLVPRLLETPEAKEVVAILNGQEAEDGEAKAGRKNKYREFVQITFECETLDVWLGGTPASPLMDQMVARWPHTTNGKPLEATHRWMRHETTGKLRVPSDVVRAYLRAALYIMERGESSIDYLTTSEVLITPHKPLTQLALPVISDRQGVGLATFEALLPGQKFLLNVTMPETNFVTRQEFAMFVATHGPNPRFGLSPGRNARHGRFEVTDVKFRGLAKEVEVQRASLENNEIVSERAKACFDRLSKMK